VTTKKYQLVLQWPASSIQDYDEMIQLEKTIAANLDGLGDVDGHDAGSGQMNIFIFTDAPTQAFEQIRSVLGKKDFMPDLKAAYRKVGQSGFTILHPDGLTSFKIV
jgi:hypothetical protein